MAGTFSQIYIQIVFAIKNRDSLINPTWETELYKYITGIVQNKGQKMLAINGTANHIHFLIGMKPTCCLSDLIREIKKSSNAFVKEKKFTKFNFQWQEGFGAFFIQSLGIG
ncbi:Transposase IS200 like protein [Bacteroidales bacterium Barb7]|nr:Transposase IS200 like protein [Bacteroidales bacterium Barb7]